MKENGVDCRTRCPRQVRRTAPRKVCVAGLLGTLVALAFPVQAELSGPEVSDLFSQGKVLFRQANDAATTDPEEAKDLYAKSVLRFERIVRDGGVRNGKLYYNIGNAWFRMNDVGRAILNYRRAEQYIPNDSNLRQNLDYARQRRVDRFEQGQPRREVLRALFFWHYDLPSGTRSLLFGISYGLAWIAASARLVWRRPFLKWVAGICALAAALFLVSLIAESVGLHRTRPGVIVAEEVVARKGDSESYEPSFQEPLHAGTEFNLLEKRPGWLRVELPDQRRCWLPADSAELVRSDSAAEEEASG